MYFSDRVTTFAPTMQPITVEKRSYSGVRVKGNTMTRIKQFSTRWGLFLLFLIVSACGASEKEQTQQFPTGEFKTVNPVYADKIRFFEDGTYAAHFSWESGSNWDGAYWGTYTITDDQLVFDDPDTECAGYPGTYHWSFDGTTLTLQVIEDTCTELPRAADLGHSWIKVP
jgi:hypothetical protein